MKNPNNLTVLGGGLVGSLLSVLMAKRGFNVDLYERRPDMRKLANYGGRSINLALSDRGWRALELAGVAEAVKKVALPMYGRMMHMQDGSTKYQPYGKEQQAIYSVSRGGLNCVLLDEAEKLPQVNLHFNQRVDHYDIDNQTITFHNVEAGSTSTLQASPIFGTDGAFSALRSSLQKTDRFDYSQDYLAHGYKELTIPPLADGSFAMDKTCLHIWPRNSFMMIALPNPDGSFTCTLFFAFEGNPSFAQLQTPADVWSFFESYFPDALPLMPTLLDDFFHNPTSSLVTVKCNPWNFADKLVLLGDAAHAIVPFYGQGMNCGFEDCLVMDKLVASLNGQWKQIFDQFAALRKPDGDAIADLAKANFVEMRDKVADPDFLLRKQIEARIQERYPNQWLPLYTMVTFSQIRYSDALKIGAQQDALMDKVMQLTDVANRLDEPSLWQQISSIIASHKPNYQYV